MGRQPWPREGTWLSQWGARRGLILLVLLTGCAVRPVVDHATDVRFDRFQTYAFAPEETRPPTLDAPIEDLDQGRIHAAIARELQAKGLRPVVSDQADLWVRYQFISARRLERPRLGVGFGLGFYRGPLGAAFVTTPAPAQPGVYHNLQVELILARERRVIWRATSQHELDPRLAGDERVARIQAIVADLFTRYPPRA